MLALHDNTTQSELVEVLYRLGRNSQLEAACEVLGAAVPPAVQAGEAAASAAVKKLRELVGKSTQVKLAAECLMRGTFFYLKKEDLSPLATQLYLGRGTVTAQASTGSSP